MTAGWGVRTVRAAMFAAVCVVLAALGHVLMSGRHVPGWALAAGLAATALAGWTLAGRERGLPLVVTLVVATQAALHSAFSLAQPTTGQSPAMDMRSADMGSMHMGAMDSMDMGHMSATTTDPSSTGMLTAHLLAALLCGLWLAHGERAAFRVLRAVATRLAAPLRLLLALPAPPHRPRLRPRRPRSERAPRLLLLGHAITSRGPPPGTAVS
ncbi:hypothetical protein [Streptomyces sp. NPDC010273]|uniref:hypothetical protein n=1 Tax=Streptomyces sp. NPDC010273 TaxID=3364829 RepID=UPI0036EAB6ED